MDYKTKNTTNCNTNLTMTFTSKNRVEFKPCNGAAENHIMVADIQQNNIGEERNIYDDKQTGYCTPSGPIYHNTGDDRDEYKYITGKSNKHGGKKNHTKRYKPRKRNLSRKRLSRRHK